MEFQKYETDGGSQNQSQIFSRSGRDQGRICLVKYYLSRCRWLFHQGKHERWGRWSHDLIRFSLGECSQLRSSHQLLNLE